MDYIFCHDQSPVLNGHAVNMAQLDWIRCSVLCSCAKICRHSMKFMAQPSTHMMQSSHQEAAVEVDKNFSQYPTFHLNTGGLQKRKLIALLISLVFAFLIVEEFQTHDVRCCKNHLIAWSEGSMRVWVVSPQDQQQL